MRFEARIITDAKGIPQRKDTTIPRNGLVELCFQATDDKGIDVILTQDDVEVGTWQRSNIRDGFHIARQLTAQSGCQIYPLLLYALRERCQCRLALCFIGILRIGSPAERTNLYIDVG